MTGPEAFPPALASLAALEDYLFQVRSHPEHQLGGPDPYLAIAYMGTLLTEHLWVGDAGTQARALGLYLLTAEAANGKRRRYPEAGTGLVPFALEDGGRPCDEAVSFVRMLAAYRTDAEDGSADWRGRPGRPSQRTPCYI